MAQAYYTPYVVATGQVPSTQTSFPALVHLSDTRFKTIGNGGHVVTGTDIRPYSNSSLATPLTYEMEFYDGTNGIWIGWVLISSLADAVTIYMGYGDAALNTDGSSTSTWPSQYKGVYHFPNGSSLGVNDSTSNALNGTNHSATASTGQIDGGISFNGSSQYVSLGDPASVDFGSSDFAFSAWINPTSNSTRAQILAKDVSGGRQFLWDIADNGTGSTRAVIFDGSGNNTAYDSGNILSANTWAHLVVVRSGNSPGAFLLYKNGASQTFTWNGSSVDFPTTMQSTTTQLDIGRREFATVEDYFSGSMDELRISASAPSANWITTEYNNQNAPNTFWTKGTEVAVGGSGGGPIVWGAILKGALIRGGRIAA